MLRMAHTLKGVAGSIGALGVQEAAKALESACREGADDERIALLLGQVDGALTPLVEELGRVPGSRAAGSAERRGVDADALQPLLGRLREHLAAFDSDALDVAEVLGRELRGTPHEGAASRLETLVGSFDFEEARAALDALVADLAASTGEVA